MQSTPGLEPLYGVINSKKRCAAPSIAPLLLLGAMLVGCGRANRHDFASRAAILTVYQEWWAEKGRPAAIKLEDYGGPGGPNESLFVYTNTIVSSGHRYQCLFGARATYWPRGVLAISDQGQTLWIRERDGKVTLSPEKYGVEP